MARIQVRLIGIPDPVEFAGSGWSVDAQGVLTIQGEGDAGTRTPVAAIAAGSWGLIERVEEPPVGQ